MPSSDYDEDLNQNPFFRTFVQNYLDLFSQCVLERWLICVPRRDSLPQHGRFSIEDFTHHILKPLNHIQELNCIGSNVSGSEELSLSDGRGANWPSFEYSSVISIDNNPSTQGTATATADGDSNASTIGSSNSTFGGSQGSLNSNEDARSCDTGRRVSGSQSPSRHCHRQLQYRKWNFETLSGCKIAYDYNTLFLDQDPHSHGPSPLPLGPGFDQRSHPRIMRVLFEETFYTADKQKYKVLCVASPLNSRVEDALYGTTKARRASASTSAPEAEGSEEIDTDGELELIQTHFAEPQTTTVATDPGDWVLTSLRDCIDFIWLHGRHGALETYDGFVKLFHHNHKALDDLPLRVQRDLVADVYQKCISAALKPERARRKKLEPFMKNLDELSEDTGARSRSRLSGEETVDESEGAAEGLDIPSILALAEAEDAAALDAQRHARFVSNFKLATETYILNALYRPLIHALSSALSVEDASLNKILRNLADVQPRDLHINEAFWEALGRAKLELGKVANLGSPLAKLDALKRTMNQLKLKLDPEGQGHGPSSTASASTTTTSADDMLPMWVYLVIKTPIGNWMAQLELLKEFRFGGFDAPGSENAYLLTTLEAAVTHLYEDRATSCYYTEFGGGTLVEDREHRPDSEDADDHLTWLPANFLFDEDDDSANRRHPLLAEMFARIRAGNLAGLEALVTGYEAERQRELKQLSHGVDEARLRLCHPLCACASCLQVLHPEVGTGLTRSALELHTDTETGGVGVSLLHMAAVCGRPKIVEYLLTLTEGPGAIAPTAALTEARDNLERTPLHYAAIRGHQNALLLLCHWGCVLEALDHMQNTALHYAALNGHESCVKALIYYGEHARSPPSISAQNCNGDTPLHFAARNGYTGIVQILVENGASITLLNARQLSAADCALNVHVTRILQRSLRRRSLCNVANYGDFVSIEVMKKEISPGNDRVLMLISDPNEGNSETADADQETASVQAPENIEASQNQSLSTKRISSDSIGVGRRSRTTCYNMLPTSPNRSRRSSLVSPLGLRANQSQTQNSVSADGETEGFQVLNPKPEPTFEPEHLKTISVDNLENTPVEIAAAVTAAPGLKRKRKEIGVRKLFTAIAIGDVPLALFYLGIPTDELANASADAIRPGDEREALAPCHPLCTCARCIARGAGLGLDVDTQNLEGLSPLHLAVMYNLHDLVRILCKFGADVYLRSKFEQKTAAEFAYERQFIEIEDTLQEWRRYYERQQNL